MVTSSTRFYFCKTQKITHAANCSRLDSPISARCLENLLPGETEKYNNKPVISPFTQVSSEKETLRKNLFTRRFPAQSARCPIASPSELARALLFAQFVHITHALVNAPRSVSRFHGFHRRFSHESRLVSVTHGSRVPSSDRAALLGLYLLHPNLLCGLILHARDRVMLIASHRYDGSSVHFFSFRIVAHSTRR